MEIADDISLPLSSVNGVHISVPNCSSNTSVVKASDFDGDLEISLSVNSPDLPGISGELRADSRHDYLPLSFVEDPSVRSNEDSLGEFSVLRREIPVSDSYLRANSPVSTIGGTNLIDDLFTFKIVDSSGHIHRIRSDVNRISNLVEAVANKMGDNVLPSSLQLKYLDDEGDAVLIGSDECLLEAVELARSSGNQVLKLLVLKSSDGSDVIHRHIFVGGAVGLVLVVVLGFFLGNRKT